MPISKKRRKSIKKTRYIKGRVKRLKHHASAIPKANNPTTREFVLTRRELLRFCRTQGESLQDTLTSLPANELGYVKEALEASRKDFVVLRSFGDVELLCRAICAKCPPRYKQGHLLAETTIARNGSISSKTKLIFKNRPRTSTHQITYHNEDEQGPRRIGTDVTSERIAECLIIELRPVHALST